MTKSQIASYIDHTILSPEAGVNEILRVCSEAKKYQFASVCINPLYVAMVHNELKDSGVKTCTVVGFPLGATPSKIKALEAVQAIEDGADEIDMVINIGYAKAGMLTNVSSDISTVVAACKKKGDETGRKIIVKVILETCFLDDDTIVNCCLCAKKAGADFVKTSTGFATIKNLDGTLLPNGASEHHVRLMRKTVGNDMGVKASGGIRSDKMAVSMIEAGASRIGTSSGVKIVENWDESLELNIQ